MSRFVEMKHLWGSQLSNAFAIGRASHAREESEKTMLELEKVLVDTHEVSIVRSRITDVKRTLRLEL